ncbi:unnamed protein product [Adineta steineri]|uniref:Uncharacterized protein n=1 Tax=Adineta steineri TaxID=433720 RepID=A0A818IPG6_9BILA|nr:unnamed protein product [Adineta steineri]CAF3530528.1 unnamed protein product [Adineta steineri]
MNQWSSGLFDCFNDCNICLYGYCCTPCLYGENAEKIDGSSCCGSCCIWYLLSSVSLCCIAHMGKRQALRNRFGLPEDCNDCAATTFCIPCAVCQEARELKFRLGSSGGAVPVVVQPMGMAMYPLLGQPGMKNQEPY